MIAIIPHDYLGTLPQQITAVSATGGVTWAILRFGLGWRKQTLDSDEQIRAILTTEMAAMRAERAADKDALRAERAADKEGFGKVEKHLREMVGVSDQRHEECEESRRAMRREMDGMHDEITGLKRQVIAQSADAVLRLDARPSEVAPHSVAAAKRIKENGEGGK